MGEQVGTVTDSAPSGAAAGPSNRSRRRTGRQSAQGVAPDAASTTQRRDGGFSYVYEARRPIKIGSKVVAPGQIIEAAVVESWPRWEGYIRAGRIARRRVPER